MRNCRIAEGYGVFRNVLENHAVGTDDGELSDGDTVVNINVGTDERAGTHADGSRLIFKTPTAHIMPTGNEFYTFGNAAMRLQGHGTVNVTAIIDGREIFQNRIPRRLETYGR